MPDPQRHRKHDGVILVCQNNDDQTVLVYGMNAEACALLGWEESEAKGKALTEIVSRQARDAIFNELEYSDNAEIDLLDVLQKTRGVGFVNAQGDEAPVTLKIMRAEAKDRHLWFRLILRDEAGKREKESLLRILSENFKGHETLDAATGLPDRASLLKDIELARHYAESKGLEACYAHVALDAFVGKTPEETAADLRHVAATLGRNLRGGDLVGRAGDGALGMVLLDVAASSARVALNRLRWAVASAGAGTRVTVSVCFAPIRGGGSADALLQACADALNRRAEPNSVTELGE